MNYRDALKLQKEDEVSLVVQGETIKVKVTHSMTDKVMKVVYLNVRTKSGTHYFSIPHHKFVRSNHG